MLITKEVEEMKRTPLFSGSCIDDFIKIYGKIPEANKLISRNENSVKLIELYKDYLKLINFTLGNKKYFLKHIGINECKKNVMISIERYLMSKLYSKYN